MELNKNTMQAIKYSIAENLELWTNKATGKCKLSLVFLCNEVENPAVRKLSDQINEFFRMANVPDDSPDASQAFKCWTITWYAEAA